MTNYLSKNEETVSDQLLYDVRVKKHKWFTDGIEPKDLCEIKRGSDIVVLTKHELMKILKGLESNKREFVVEVDNF